MTMKKHSLDHDVIYLQPPCDECIDERCWCQDDNGPCDDCGKPWVKYVRAESSEIR